MLKLKRARCRVVQVQAPKILGLMHITIPINFQMGIHKEQKGKRQTPKSLQKFSKGHNDIYSKFSGASFQGDPEKHCK